MKKNTAISVGTTAAPYFARLGIYEAFQALGKPSNMAHFFLSLVEDKGALRPIYQTSLHKTLAILEQRKKTAVLSEQ